VKPEWGAKRACPKCNTRFYDLTKDDPVTCIACGFAWVPDPILKSKQPLPFEAAKPVAAAAAEGDEALAGDDLDLDADEVEEDAVDNDDDLDGDDDLAGVVERDEDDEG
jgi:uncharacterized protein (TIGR02300 family)